MVIQINFSETDISDVNFSGAKGLTQEQLADACADPEGLPFNLPKDAATGAQLEWNGKACEKDVNPCY